MASRRDSASTLGRVAELEALLAKQTRAREAAEAELERVAKERDDACTRATRAEVEAREMRRGSATAGMVMGRELGLAEAELSRREEELGAEAAAAAEAQKLEAELRRQLSEASGDGLSSTAQPAASAGATLTTACMAAAEG